MTPEWIIGALGAAAIAIVTVYHLTRPRAAAEVETVVGPVEIDTSLPTVLVSIDPGPVETPASIADWAEATFGLPANEGLIVDRAMKELAEAREALRYGAPMEEVLEELADVLIVLFPVFHRAGADPAEEVDRKMEINRARSWETAGNGVGQHVRGGQP